MSSKSRGESGDFLDTLKGWFGGGSKPARKRGGKDMSGARGAKRGGTTPAANKRSASQRKAPARKTKAAGRAGSGARKMRKAGGRKR